MLQNKSEEREGWKVWSYGLMAMLWRVHSIAIWLIGSHMTMVTLADEPKLCAGNFVGRAPNLGESACAWETRRALDGRRAYGPVGTKAHARAWV